MNNQNDYWNLVGILHWVVVFQDKWGQPDERV